MIYEDYTLDEHGFYGHLVKPDHPKYTGVIVLSGGEKSLLPGKSVAKEFAKEGYTAMAVPIFGAKGLPDSADRMPLDPVLKAAQFLQAYAGIHKVVTYGMSMGSLFALLVGVHNPDIAGVISVSGTHVVFEGELDAKHNSSHSLITFEGEELSYVPVDLSRGVREAFEEAYQDEEAVMKAVVPVEQCHCPVLFLGSDADEEWPADHSAKVLKDRLEEAGYPYSYRNVIYADASHMMGMMPQDLRGKFFMKAAKLTFKSMKEHPQACQDAVLKSRKEILDFLTYVEEGSYDINRT